MNVYIPYICTCTCYLRTHKHLIVSAKTCLIYLNMYIYLCCSWTMELLTLSLNKLFVQPFQVCNCKKPFVAGVLCKKPFVAGVLNGECKFKQKLSSFCSHLQNKIVYLRAGFNLANIMPYTNIMPYSFVHVCCACLRESFCVCVCV